MENINPFSFVFGKVPKQHITRLSQNIEVMETFNSENPKSQAFLITGIRGVGKTVLMTYIAKKFEADENWVVIHLNPESDLLALLAAKLYENTKTKSLFNGINFGVSLIGISASINYSSPVTNTEAIVEKMLKILQKAEKKLLITIDEVSKTPQIKAFISAFQIFIRNEYPVFLLMTGLYENIRNLQDEKNLTFLYRTSRIDLGPLNLLAICNSYETIFNISKNEAARLSSLTKGYPFAYQVLGYLLWEKKTTAVTKDIENEYDLLLAEFVYTKIWSELSAGDKDVLIAISKSSDNSTSNISEILDMPANKLSVYRKRLSVNGLIDISKHGYMYFALPRFAEFINAELAFELT